VPAPGALSPDRKWRWNGAAWVPAWSRPYASPRARAIATQLCLGMTVAALVLVGLAEVANAVIFDAEHPDENAEELISRVVISSIVLWALVDLATSIPFAMWCHRVYRNLPALGAQGVRQSPAWAAGWWFIPFANLWMPLQTLLEASQASEARTPAGAASPPVLMGVWWGAWLISWILINVWARMPVSTEGQVVAAAEFGQLVVLVRGVAAALAITVVFALTRKQDAAFRGLQAAAAN